MLCKEGKKKKKENNERKGMVFGVLNNKKGEKWGG